jgi:hypothetical protein
MKQCLKQIIKLSKRSKKTVLLVVIFGLVTFLLSTAISVWLYKPIAETFYHTFNLQLPSSVTLKTIGLKAYWDSTLTNETTMVPWLHTYPGGSFNVTLYLQSASNVDTTLDLETTNWIFLNSHGAIVSGPSNSTNYMNLTWDYHNTTLSPKQTLPVTLTLSIDNSNNLLAFLVTSQVTTFNFDIIIRAGSSSEP